jgi:hypothetical protein
VFSFTSTLIAVVAVAMASSRPVCAVTSDPILAASLTHVARYLAPLGKSLAVTDVHSAAGEEIVVVAIDGAAVSGSHARAVGALLCGPALPQRFFVTSCAPRACSVRFCNILRSYITDADAVPPAAVLVARKRCAAPFPHCFYVTSCSHTVFM